ncbi:MAG TPA: Dabb family protein [Candidatus Udaeobacter sp.]|nr:Dabb family protein [Candidatus Udaeobacter sp.]
MNNKSLLALKFYVFCIAATAFHRSLRINRRATCIASAVNGFNLRASSETPISFSLMVHHVVLYKLKPEVTPARVEAMMMNTRMQLLKIPEVLSIKCGKRIDPELPWPFFIAIDFESMDKYAIFREDPIFVKFMEEVIKPNTEDSLDLDFEMDPGKDVRFS